MKQRERILVAVGDDRSRKTVQYLARLLGGRSDVGVCLYHRLPAVPPELREHRGSEDPNEEAELGRRRREGEERWVASRADEAKRLLDEARDELRRADLSQEMVEEHVEEAADSPEEHLADACIAAARETRCSTIVLGRKHLGRLAELFSRHASSEIVRKAQGLTVWVVE